MRQSILKYLTVGIGVFYVLAASRTVVANPNFLSEAQALLERGQNQQAYSLLKSNEDMQIGDAEFDRALAQAAAGIGAHNEATLALERLLQLDGNAVASRMELAKLYQAMANDEQAKHQFDKVLSMTSNANLIQEAQSNLKLVEKNLAKRRKRPSYEPQIASRSVQTAATTSAPSRAQVDNAVSSDLAAVMAEARRALKDGKPLAAYETLLAHEFEGSGNIDFDYLLGVAANDAGKPDKATLALERVLAVNPNFAGARIDMGRAYMLLGNTVQAKEEFDTVLKLNPPDPVKRQVESFVAEIEKRNQAARTHWSGFFGISLGHDSNVNAAPRDAEQFIPIFGQSVLLDPGSVETASSYLGLGGRIQVNHQVSKNAEVYAGFDLDLRRNYQASQFDGTGANLRLGSIITVAQHEYEFSLAFGKTYLDQKHYRDLVGGAIQWRINLNEDNQLQSVAQFNRMRFAQDDASVFDTNQTILGFNWLRVLGGSKQGVALLGIYAGKETDINGNPSGAKDSYGARAGAYWSIDANWAVFGSMGVAFSDYDGFEISHQKVREDKRYDLSIGTSYGLWEDWSLRPQINFGRQDSNISLYSFNRREIFVTLRRDWR